MLRSATVLAVAACVLGVVCLPGVSDGQQEDQLVGRTATGTLEGDKGTNDIRLEFLSGGRVRVSQTAEDGREYVGTWSLDGNRISMRIGPSSFSGKLEGNRITGSRSRDDGIRDSWKATLSDRPERRLVGRTATGTLEGDKGTNDIRLEFLSEGRVRVGQTAEDGKEYVGTWSLDGNRISMRIGPSSFSGTLEGNRITGSRSRDDGIRDSWKATLSGVDPTDEEEILLGAEVEAPPDIPLPLPRLAKPIPRSAVERCIADE